MHIMYMFMLMVFSLANSKKPLLNVVLKPDHYSLMEQDISFNGDPMGTTVMTTLINNAELCNLKIFTEEPVIGTVQLQVLSVGSPPIIIENFEGHYNEDFVETPDIQVQLTCISAPCGPNVYTVSLYYVADADTANPTFVRESVIVDRACFVDGVVHLKKLPDGQCNIHVSDEGDCPITTKWFIVPTGDADTTGSSKGDFKETDGVIGDRTYMWSCDATTGNECRAYIDIYCVSTEKQVVYEEIADDNIFELCINVVNGPILKKVYNLPQRNCDIFVNDKGDCPITTEWFISFHGFGDLTGSKEGDYRMSDSSSQLQSENLFFFHGDRTYIISCKSSLGTSCEADVTIYCESETKQKKIKKIKKDSSFIGMDNDGDIMLTATSTNWIFYGKCIVVVIIGVMLLNLCYCALGNKNIINN